MCATLPRACSPMTTDQYDRIKLCRIEWSKLEINDFYVVLKYVLDKYGFFYVVVLNFMQKYKDVQKLLQFYSVCLLANYYDSWICIFLTGTLIATKSLTNMKVDKTN